MKQRCCKSSSCTCITMQTQEVLVGKGTAGLSGRGLCGSCPLAHPTKSQRFPDIRKTSKVKSLQHGCWNGHRESQRQTQTTLTDSWATLSDYQQIQTIPAMMRLRNKFRLSAGLDHASWPLNPGVFSIITAGCIKSCTYCKLEAFQPQSSSRAQRIQGQLTSADIL